MKKFLGVILILLSIRSFHCHGVMVTGSLDAEIETENTIERLRARFATEKLSYTAGGVTFTYPTVPSNLFTQTPIVRLAIEQNTPHADTETYTAEITANNALSTTVMVYKISSGVVSEAATGSVIIHFMAAGL